MWQYFENVDFRNKQRFSKTLKWKKKKKTFKQKKKKVKKNPEQLFAPEVSC